MKDAITIPRFFYNGSSRKPFTNCMVCDMFLLKEGTHYLIEKSIRQIPEMKLKETLFEYAICMDCSVRMNAALSVESRQRIDAYFADNTDLPGRLTELQTGDEPKFQKWIQKCLIKKTPVSKSSEYQIIAQCNGDKLVLSHMPFVISVQAMDEITQLLSAKSLGEIDDFIGKYFTGPPEVSEILKKRLVLI